MIGSGLGEGATAGLLGLHSRLTRKMILWSLLVGGLLSLLITAGETYQSYRETIERIDRHIQVLGSYSRDALAQSLWSFDQDQVRLQLAGFMRSGDITAVHLLPRDGAATRLGDTPTGTEMLQHTFVLEHLDNGKLHDLGRLVLYKDTSDVRSAMLARWALAFGGNSLVIVLVMAMLLLIYQRIVRQPLALVARELSSIRPDDLRAAAAAPPPHQTGPAADELEELARAVVLLKSTGGTALRELDARNTMQAELLDRLDESRRLLQTIIDTSPIRVFWKDLDLRYLGCNPLFARDAGCELPSELIGRRDEELGWHDQAAAYQADDLQVIRSGLARIGFEEPQTAPDGSSLWLRTSKVPLRDGQGRIIGVLGVYDDITGRKQLEIQLETHRDNLEELVAKRTRELAEARDAAEAASRAKSAFLANMSHELRTPLNAIMGMTALALRRDPEPVLRGHLAKVETASRHLLGVINDILDLSKIEAERMVLDETDFQLRNLLAELDNMFGARARDKQVGFEIDLPAALARLQLRGDSLRLKQVLINLTGNALKFTDQGRIIVRVSQPGVSGARPGARLLLRFEVIDTGIGIDQDDLQRLFTSFEQADNSTTRRYGGTGLGLAISQRLIRLMGGEIGVSSTPGQGSLFWFTVTMSAGADICPEDPAPQSPEDRLRSLHADTPVLLVEDDLINREVSMALLEHAGLHYDYAENGQQAVEMARRQRYGAILMDIQMPVMNGFDATAAIRADSLNRTSPIIAMTANAFDEDRSACLAAGMNDHLGKPIEPSLFYATVLDWLNRQLPAAQASG